MTWNVSSFAPLLVPLAAASLLVGCGGRLEDARYPTGSQSIVSSTDYAAVYTVDADAGLVVRVDGQSGRVRTTEVGGEPTRLARANGRVLATLRADRAIAVLDEVDGDLELSHTVSVGAEPFGIVASEDGTRVYVAESVQGRVSELDGSTLERLDSWDVRGEPRWLALHPSGKSLYVGTAFGDGLHRIDLAGDAVVTLGLPTVTGFHRETFETLELTGRVTGDLAVSPDGRALAVPVLYVDNLSPVAAPSVDADGNSTSEDQDDFEDEFFEGGGYDGGGSPRFNPGVALLSLDPKGIPVDDETVVVSITGSDDEGFVRSSYPGAVTFTPTGESVLVALEGADAVVSVTLKAPLQNNTRGGGVGMEMDAGFLGGAVDMESRERRTATTDAGPRGFAFLSKTDLRVHSFLDRTIAAVDVASIDPDAVTPPTATVIASAGVVFAEESLPADLADGRRLFYSANDAQMASVGAGVSCATCHLDGRNDGLTWTFEDEVKRQTPSLAGVISLTAPVTWTDDVVSVTDEVVITSQGRMGGDGLGRTDADKVAAFIDWTREVDVPLADSTSERVVRGAALFQRKDVGCADCHSGVAYTDNEPYAMYGLENVRTRSLVGVAASAPYFHDGSSATLRAVLERSRDGSMGDTSALSEIDLDDLEAFLLSL